MVEVQWQMENRGKNNHINVLECMAISTGLRALCANLPYKHIRIMTDNSTAVAYMIAMGDTRSSACNDVAFLYGLGQAHGIPGFPAVISQESAIFKQISIHVITRTTQSGS